MRFAKTCVRAGQCAGGGRPAASVRSQPCRWAPRSHAAGRRRPLQDGAWRRRRRRDPGRKSLHLDTLGSYPEAEVIEAITITDPGHPLYGRSFTPTSARSGANGYVYVAHRSGTTLRLAVAATSLCPLRHDVVRTKLTLKAIHDLLRLAAEGKHACPSAPATSGPACPLTGAASSSTTLPPCFGR